MRNLLNRLKLLGYEEKFVKISFIDDLKLRNEITDYLTLCDIQKWIRDKFDIDINIFRSWAMKHSYFYLILIKNDIEMHEVGNKKFREDLQQITEPNRSYEQSLKNAIEKSIEIIKKESYL